jgi:hypothetical protein
MGYTKSSSETDLPTDLVAAMASLLGLPVNAEELPGLTAAVRDQLDSLAAFGGLDLEGEMPAVDFDCRWRAGDD